MAYGRKIAGMAVLSSQIDYKSVNYYFEVQIGLSRKMVDSRTDS